MTSPRFIVTKSVRVSEHNYQGPTLEAAGVARGVESYATRAEAEAVAALLSTHNVISFVVVEL